MKITLISLALSLGIAAVPAQDQKPAASAEKATAPAVALNEAEQKFKDLLTNATMEGRWAPIEDGKLGDEKQDKYTIVSANKVNGNSWIINSRMKYRDREMTIPFPVEVQWAGSTPVIVVDNLQVPGGRAYSARVLFYNNTYAGSWTGGEKGGLLNGIISKTRE